MKIIITEKQARRLKLINEDTQIQGHIGEYVREVGLSFSFGNKTLKGYEINDIIANKNIPITFDIELENRKWGIGGVEFRNIMGPKEIEIEIEYYINDEIEIARIKLPLDWGRLKTEVSSGEGIVTLGDDMDIYLTNDEQGNIIFDRMEINVYKI